MTTVLIRKRFGPWRKVHGHWERDVFFEVKTREGAWVPVARGAWWWPEPNVRRLAIAL